MKIRDLDIAVPLALAPMVGLSHSALRTLVVEMEGAGLYFTEMLSARRLPSENDKVSPFLIREASERPLFYQMFISDLSELEAAVARLVELDAQGIDLNLGCPAPQLRKIGAGLELVKNVKLTSEIIRALRDATELPLSVKIRLGEPEEGTKLLETCLRFQDLGIDLITIHARFNRDKFCRRPHWQLLEPVTEKLTIPVFANGGIFTVDDARTCLQRSGAAGLMLGRGAVHKPWLFNEIAREIYHSPVRTTYLSEHEAYLRFIVLLKQRFKPERRLGRLKQFTHYFASNYSFGHLLSSRIQNCSTMDQAEETAAEFLNNHASAR